MTFDGNQSKRISSTITFFSLSLILIFPLYFPSYWLNLNLRASHYIFLLILQFFFLLTFFFISFSVTRWKFLCHGNVSRFLCQKNRTRNTKIKKKWTPNESIEKTIFLLLVDTHLRKEGRWRTLKKNWRERNDFLWTEQWTNIVTVPILKEMEWIKQKKRIYRSITLYVRLFDKIKCITDSS